MHSVPDDSNQEDTRLGLAKLSYERETSTNGASLIKSTSISTNPLLLRFSIWLQQLRKEIMWGFDLFECTLSSWLLIYNFLPLSSAQSFKSKNGVLISTLQQQALFVLGDQQCLHNVILGSATFQAAEWTLMPCLWVVAMTCRKNRTQSLQQNCLKGRKDVQGWSIAVQLGSLQQHRVGKSRMFFAQLKRAQSAP